MKLTKNDFRFAVCLPLTLVLMFFVVPLWLFSNKAARWVGDYALWMIDVGGRPKLGKLGMRERLTLLVFIGMLVAAASALAMSTSADGSVTLTKEEWGIAAENFQRLRAERDAALKAARAIEGKLNALAKSRCI